MRWSRSSLAKVTWYSFLDLICCSLGAALLLFLIIASVEEKKFKHDNRLLGVRVTHERGFKAEIGIEIKAPGSEIWRRANDAAENYVCFSAPSQPSSGAESFVLIPDPAFGRWSFRPYLIDYPDIDQEDKSIVIEMKVFGQETLPECEVLQNPDGQVLFLPGHTGKELEIYVAARGE